MSKLLCKLKIDLIIDQEKISNKKFTFYMLFISFGPNELTRMA